MKFSTLCSPSPSVKDLPSSSSVASWIVGSFIFLSKVLRSFPSSLSRSGQNNSKFATIFQDIVCSRKVFCAGMFVLSIVGSRYGQRNSFDFTSLTPFQLMCRRSQILLRDLGSSDVTDVGCLPEGARVRSREVRRGVRSSLRKCSGQRPRRRECTL